MDKALQEMLDISVTKARKVLRNGKVANYIPELSKADPDALGAVLTDVSGEIYKSGDYEEPFTMQSVSKVVSLIYAMEKIGVDEVFSRVGMEPSGSSFMEMTTLSDFSNKPSNPMINAGAIVISSLISEVTKFEDFQQYIRHIFHSEKIVLHESAYKSEMAHSEKNHALTWELKRLQLLSNDVERSVEFYTKTCALTTTATELSYFAAVLANSGKDLVTGEQIISRKTTQMVLSLMFTCGLYNGTGSFAVLSGLPAKSGVGGGIMAVVKGKCGIGTYGPSLDANGNSIGSINLIEYLADRLDWHVFKL